MNTMWNLTFDEQGIDRAGAGGGAEILVTVSRPRRESN